MQKHQNRCKKRQKEEKTMKSTGIVRKVDELGRIVLPIELRRTLDINERDALETVSYTHLDVYKRQVSGSRSRGHRRPPPSG